MASSRVNFGEWLPDQPGIVGALTVAKNVYPRAVGYGPFMNEVDYSDAASEDLTAVVGAIDTSGVSRVIAGGPTKLFLFDSTDLSLDDISATTYATVEDRWRFTQFGDNLITAGYPNTLQYYDLTTTGNFQLITGAPQARHVTVVRDFVVTGNTEVNASRVQWSGINDPTTWSSSAVTQSDFQDIPDGGEVRGITGGEFGLILCARSIHRMSYVGTPLVFQFDNIARNLGCYESNSVIQWQGVTYFLGDDGFYSCNGQQVEAIGAEKVNRFFFDTLIEANLSQMSAAVEPSKNLVMWGYPTLDDTYRILVYHLVTKRWSYVDTTVNRIADATVPGITLEGLDAFSSSIDALGTSLDSRLWLGGKMMFSGVRGTKIITFTGANKQASIETADLNEIPSAAMVTLAKPIVDNGSASVAIASRFLLNETPNFNTAVAADAENRVGLRSVGKFHRLRVNPTGDNWQTAIGVEIESQPAGSR
jgi:hypothetical protein